MADINVERKGTSIWPWIIGLVVLALAIWLLAELFGGEDEVAQDVAYEEPVTEVQPLTPEVSTPEPVAAAAGIPVSQIIESPATWTGRTLGGEVRVVEVPTDRGFWIEDQGERLFVVLNDAPTEQPVNINPGQSIRMSEAVVYDEITSVPNELDADTRRIVEGQPVFLAVDDQDIEILTPAQ